MITLQVSRWELVPTGYLDPNGDKRGKSQVISQIDFCCQYEQRGQNSCTTSTLTLRNEEAVTHHFSYDRETEKEMGSARKTAKTQKVLGQAMDDPGRA